MSEITVLRNEVVVVMKMSLDQAVGFHQLRGKISPKVAFEYMTKEQYDNTEEVWDRLDDALVEEGAVT